MNWVQEELKHADLGDVRRNKRLIKIVEDLSSQPNASVTKAVRDNAAMQGLYPPIKRYPNNGDLYYNGDVYADSYFKWFNVGDWERSNPAFEMDMTVVWNYFASCTTYNNLPQPHYDDCPTAGVSEPGSTTNFGFGTWEAQNIVNSLTYKGILSIPQFNLDVALEHTKK